LTIWLTPKPSGQSEVIVLEPKGHTLTESEFAFSTATRVPFVPDLVYLLPETEVKIGETWIVPRVGTVALVGQPVADGALTGKLSEIRADRSGTGRMAVFTITGQIHAFVPPAEGALSVNAQVEFAFTPPAPATEAQKAASETPRTVEAVGAITRVLSAWEATVPTTPDNPRLHTKRRRELIVERRFNKGGKLLEIPSTEPKPTVENSWLTFVDERHRFHFRHPQQLRLHPENSEPDSITLARVVTGSARDTVILNLDRRANLVPDRVQRDVIADLKSKGMDVTLASEGLRQGPEWGNLRVHAFELVLNPTQAADAPTQGRHYQFGYVVQTGRDHGLYVEAMTAQDPPKPFQREAEQIIQNFRFGPPEAK
jgi:hypothetical protein